MSNFDLSIEEVKSDLAGKIDSHLDRVHDWESNLDEHILHISSIEIWDHDQQIDYILKKERDLRIKGEELMCDLLFHLSGVTHYERDAKYDWKLSEDDKSNILSVDLDRYWVNSDTFSRLHSKSLCDDKLRCIFDDLEHEVVQGCGTFVFDTFVFYNPEIESWLMKWKGIIVDYYHGDQFKENSSPENIL